MKKLFIFAASSLLMLASCSESNDFVNNVAQDSPIAFSAYNGNGTRAGYAGDISSTTLQTTGFGVFAYNTGASDYGATGHSTMATTEDTPNWAPNFMWNQQVRYSSGWVYTPLKYWPNGIDTNGASEATVQKLSFFAYAPYVASCSGEGSGITALSANTDAGDPKITYSLSGAGNDVDLLWGTTSTNGATVGGVAQAGVGSDLKVSEVSVANLNENLTKMKTNGKVGFNFKHALAKIKDVQVNVDPDVTMEVDANSRPLTKITVSNITITSTNYTRTAVTEGEGYKSTKGGVFNLATGIWTLTEADEAQSSTEQITPTGDSGTYNVLNAAMIDPATVNAENIFGASGITGVTTDYVTAYNSTDRRPLMLMPGTYPRFTVAITYTVRTEDANLAEGYSETTQTITKTVDFANPVLLNKQYTLKLSLGLTSIKVEAVVADWDNDNDGEHTITLPVNVVPAEP
ncbi:hypothetical protein [Segatella albensis]|uniref:hypothetical protein n=1 Tax=Segatella albensis TaxID=77768 RepID=UPI000407A990|nr:hypothetical protein [Segatella albensis]